MSKTEKGKCGTCKSFRIHKPDTDSFYGKCLRMKNFLSHNSADFIISREASKGFSCSSYKKAKTKEYKVDCSIGGKVRMVCSINVDQACSDNEFIEQLYLYLSKFIVMKP